MRLRTRISCVIVAGAGISSLAAFAAGCVSDDNASPAGDSGVDSTTTPQDAGAPAIDTGVDSAPSNLDAGQDAADAAVVDSGFDAGCAPSLPTNWQPPPYVPAIGQYTNQCNLAFNGQIDGYWQDCLGDASTPTTCATYLDSGTDQTCASCLVTPQDASAYGAAVVFTVPQINLAGCIQLADDSDAGLACATFAQAAQTCTQASCLPSCTVTSDPATVAAYIACITAAATSTCSTYTAAATACLAAEHDAGSYASTECFTTPATAENEFDEIGNFFCNS